MENRILKRRVKIKKLFKVVLKAEIILSSLAFIYFYSMIAGNNHDFKIGTIGAVISIALDYLFVCVYKYTSRL